MKKGEWISFIKHFDHCFILAIKDFLKIILANWQKKDT